MPPLRTPYFKDISMESCRTNSSKFRGAGCRRSKLSGQWSDDDYDLLENGAVVVRIFLSAAAAPRNRPWMWANGHSGDIRRAAHDYEPTREEAMAPFAKSWRQE
jgi:hypothetical protein